jgi:hypothetical protein
MRFLSGGLAVAATGDGPDLRVGRPHRIAPTVWRLARHPAGNPARLRTWSLLPAWACVAVLPCVGAARACLRQAFGQAGQVW